MGTHVVLGDERRKPLVTRHEVGTESTTIRFHCPTHGAHTVCLENLDEIARLELNTPLRNLTRTLAYLEDTGLSVDPSTGIPTRVHMRVTGADYGGAYQESMLLRPLARLARCMPPPLDADAVWPVFVYAPLITDWSGAKLSKSLYVRAEAYRYLRERDLEWLLEFRRMREEGRDRAPLYAMVEAWAGLLGATRPSRQAPPQAA